MTKYELWKNKTLGKYRLCYKLQKGTNYEKVRTVEDMNYLQTIKRRTVEDTKYLRTTEKHDL